MSRDDLTTPALLVDLDVVDENVRQATLVLEGTGILLRPHVKTHRTPALAYRQIGPLARGLTCATVGEAEVMARAGLDDLLIANEVASADKYMRIAELATCGARLVVAVDNAEAALALGDAVGARGGRIELLVDVDVGLGRCGVRELGEVVSIATACAGHPALGVRGLMGYEGRLRATSEDRQERVAAAFQKLRRARSALTDNGIPVDVISGGGTSTMLDALTDGTMTEIQAGTYALMEDDLDGLSLPFRPAVSVRARVISCREGQAVIDAGLKSLGCEYGAPRVLTEDWLASRVSEEHTVLQTNGDSPHIGDLVYLRPSQVRTTFNLYGEAELHRGGAFVDRVSVEARGSSA
jgi:D-serine deaminase-like pyridoxal phosphate-dependent protein